MIELALVPFAPPGVPVLPDADALAAAAAAALVAEAELTPKPGLVDARGPGAHADIDIETLRTSAEALRGCFRDMVRAAAGTAPSQELREELARIGREGERAMFAVTHGANTHRGAIWALGLLVAATAMRPAAPADMICARAAALARFADRGAPAADTNGARACRSYGVAGARGEAVAGFPHARLALATLRRAREHNGDPTSARLDALMAVMASLDDTCLLHRGGRRALKVARLGARAVLAAGGAGSPEGRAALLALDRRLLALNASPGGAADMLAAALLLDTLETQG